MDTRPRTRARRSYEDFEPSTELVQEHGSDTLLVELSGFSKEQVRAQVNNSGTLKITGERPLRENKWRRFSKDFQVAKNCNTNEIRATFEDGILFVTMPKFEDQWNNERVNETQRPEPTWNSPPPPPVPQLPPFQTMPNFITPSLPPEAQREPNLTQSAERETPSPWGYFFLPPPEAQREPKSTVPEAQQDPLEYSKQQNYHDDEKMMDGSMENTTNLTHLAGARFSLEDLKNRSIKLVNTGLNESIRISVGSMVVVVILVALAVWFSANYSSTSVRASEIKAITD